MAKTTPNTSSSAVKKPTLIAYHVRDAKGGEGFWTRIGAAWAHEDDQGFTVQIDMVPLDGRITLRTPSERD